MRMLFLFGLNLLVFSHIKGCDWYVVYIDKHRFIKKKLLIISSEVVEGSTFIVDMVVIIFWEIFYPLID